MIELLKIVGCGVVYFLVVYLFVIRREARPIIPWAVCIGSQVVSIVLFYRVVELVKTYLLPEDRFGNLGMVIPSGLLCIGNLAVIYVMFGVVLPKINAKGIAAESGNREEIVVAPLSSVLGTAVNAGDTQSTDADEADITIDFIKTMISDGRDEEARKYLRMLAYYGKDEDARAEAKELIAKLNENDDKKEK